MSDTPPDGDEIRGDAAPGDDSDIGAEVDEDAATDAPLDDVAAALDEVVEPVEPVDAVDAEPASQPVLAAGEASINPDAIRAIEAIVMVSSEPVGSDVLAELIGVPVPTVEALCRRLSDTYDEAGAGFQLVRVAGGWRYQSHPDLAAYVERYVLDGQTARLSAAALETLAIVAYKQPISRAQVASIRGVDPDGVLRTLQARGYIDQIGRDPGPGQALLWGTTHLFLEKLGLNSLADLPPLAEFVPGADVVEALEHGLRVPSSTAPTAPEPSRPAEPVAQPEPAATDHVDAEHVDAEHVEAEPEPAAVQQLDAEPEPAAAADVDVEPEPGSAADEVASAPEPLREA